MEPQLAINQDTDEATGNPPQPDRRSAAPLLPQQDGQPCPTCGNRARSNITDDWAPNFVYAIGRIQPRFSSLGVEKEFAQVAAAENSKGLTDRQLLVEVVKKNRYLARRLCFVLTIEGLDTYILQYRDPMDLDLLIESIRPEPNPNDLDLVIGVRGPIAPPEMCNGLMIPLVLISQLYSFNRDILLGAIPHPEGVSDEQFKRTAEEVLDRILMLADNAGSTEEHRALNYLAVRYPAIYGRTAELHNQGVSLTAVSVRSSALSGTRKIVDVIFSFTNRSTDFTEKFIVRVDVTEDFPFLVTKLSPYYDQ